MPATVSAGEGPMSASFPFIRHEGGGAVVAYHRGRPVPAEEFLGEVAALAAQLPARGEVVNLCGDRYHFAVAFGAALSRGQVSLLPPSDAPGVLDDIAGQFPGAYFLVDGAAPAVSTPVLRYPEGRQAIGEAPAIPRFAASQRGAVLFTSGSTGQPKPHARSWGALVASARAAGKAQGITRLPGAALIGTVPHQHSYGLESTVMLPLQHGLAFQGERPFYASDVTAALEAVPRPRVLVTTPVHLRLLLAEEEVLPAADLMLSATAPLSPELAAAAEARFGARLWEIYGCSEVGQVAGRWTSTAAAWRCLPGMRLSQDARGTWASGELVDGEPVLLQDVIELEAPDRFLLHGRTADLVNIAGKRTSLAYLNHQLNAIAGVRDGVFVVPDTPESSGAGVTRLMALVVAPGLTAETILAALRRRVDAAFLPRPLCFVDALPRNALGKLPREAVLALVARAV
jgi:acyl-coenzyme A synthetase/AMP-(fatty) acid ligase